MEARRTSKHFVEFLHAVDLVIETGEVVVLIGASGSSKCTLSR